MEWIPRCWPRRLVSNSAPLMVLSPRRHRHRRDTENRECGIVPDKTLEGRKDSQSTSASTATSVVEHRNRAESCGEPPPAKALSSKQCCAFIGGMLSSISLLTAAAFYSSHGSALSPSLLPPHVPPVQTVFIAQDVNKSDVYRDGSSEGDSHVMGGNLTVGRWQQEKEQNLPWMYVASAKAAHPAMYVPADGVVYCPIAKASAYPVMRKSSTQQIAVSIRICLPPHVNTRQPLIVRNAVPRARRGRMVRVSSY